jgi:pimeloyl-ACP methyl ester carboxylesterase
MSSKILKQVKLTNGEEYGYREFGNGNETILLIHGNLVSSRQWGPTLEAFGEDFRVIALDLRGAGISTYNTPVNSFGDWARDVKLFCDELGLKDFTLVGWSMGGGISQQFVVDYPNYAKKLVLYEAAPPSGVPYHKKGPAGEFLAQCYDNREELLEDKVQLKPMIDALEQNNRGFMKYLWDALILNVRKPEDAEYAALINDIYLTRNLRDAAWAAHNFNISHIHNGVVMGSGEVDKIELPVLVCAGDKDVVIPLQLSQFTASEIGKNARLEVLPNCGHTPHYDNLELVVKKIKEFIAE